MTKKTKVLFVCVHNSARSQMAEVFLKQLGGEGFEVESAGYEPGKLNPLVIEVMQEEVTRLNWSFKDPSSFEGSWEEKLQQTREIRDAIKQAITKWIPTIK